MRRSRTRFVVLALSFAFAISATFVTTAWAATTTTKQISVVAKSAWTSTAIKVHRGDRITVIASGKAHFGPPPIDALPPSGIRRRPDCERLGGANTKSWPAPALDCYALIARIGSGPIIDIGRAKNFVSDGDGPLELGVNDHFLTDNSGAWSAQVVAASSASSSGSSPVIPIALAIVAIAAVAALVALVRRSRSRRRAAAPEGIADPSLLVPPDAARGVATVAPDNDEVNIFDVALDPNALRVGYSYFPPGTIVRWFVYSDGGASMRGEFAAEGGGGTPHVISLPFDAELPDAEAEVRFEWTVAGVPFRYAVKRAFARH